MLYDTTWGMAVGFAVTGLFMVTVATGSAPWRVALQSWKQITKNPQIVVILGLMGMVLLINKVELTLENTYLNHFVHWDFTSTVQLLEGNLDMYLQKLSNIYLTNLFTFMYIFVFPTLIWVSFLVYNHYEEDQMVKKLFYGFILNYLIAVPFYLFVPVNEAWFQSAQIKPLIEQVYKAYNTQYRLLSGLNNCFPSLHTSISVTMALVAWQGKSRRWRYLATASAILIVFSTLYLGIHWFADVVAGIIMATLIVKAAGFLAENDYKWTLVWPNLAKLKANAYKNFLVTYLRKTPFFSSFF